MSKLIDRSYLVGKRIQNVIVNSWSSGNCDVTCTPLRKKIKRAEKLGHKVHVVRSMEEFLRL